MPLTDLKTLLEKAEQNKFAVGAFEVWNLESVQIVVSTAERLNSPVILAIGPLEIKYAGIEPLSELALSLSKKAKVPVGIHLDHGDSLSLVEETLNHGFTSVMIDVSRLPFQENVETTAKAVKMAQQKNIPVEAELGHVGGLEGDVAAEKEEQFLTDPQEAVTFVQKTGIDALAVAIGTAHGFYQKKPQLDLPRLKQIRELVKVPLVLHGGSGLQKEEIQASIQAGISKINIATEFIHALGRGVYETLASNPAKVNVLTYFSPSRKKGEALVAEKLKLFGSVGKAALYL